MDFNTEFGFPCVIREQNTPHIAKKIFNLLDQEALCKSRAVSRGWQILVDSSTTFWSDFSSRQMIEAVKDERLDIIQLFIENAKEPNPPADTGFTPLHMAATVGHIEIFKMIFNCALDKNPKDWDDLTPLHFAAHDGYREICQLIICKVTDKNPRAKGGKTPLHYAARKGCLEVYKLSSNSVGHENPSCISGRTLLHEAAHQGHYDICKLIITSQ